MRKTILKVCSVTGNKDRGDCARLERLWKHVDDHASLEDIVPEGPIQSLIVIVPALKNKHVSLKRS